MVPTKSETIAAISTPVGRSAIGVIRVSGPRTYEILKKIFKPRGKRTFPSPFCSFPGTIVHPETGVTIDHVLISTYRAPSSYTGEDLVEIGAHGNPIVLTSLLTTLFECGVVQAEAGEFTRRAFLNGKMNLLDVEATSQILTAASQSQAFVALNQLDGGASRRLSRQRERLLDYLAHIEAGLNFPEDAVDDVDETAMNADFDEILQDLKRFHDSARQGNLMANGVSLALVGRPNTGKSSVLNAILGRERAIVTDIPGTTRDTLEESWTIGGFPVRLIDTAGLRQPGDVVEALGIERTKKAIESAFLVLAVFDASQPMTYEDDEVLRLVQDQDKPTILVINKTDVSCPASLSLPASLPCVEMSAVTGRGLDRLMLRIEEVIRSKGLSALSDLVLLGAQQTDALGRAIASLTRAREGIGTMYHDLLSVDVNDAIRYLGMVTGETVDSDTLDRIFERFCIGK